MTPVPSNGNKRDPGDKRVATFGIGGLAAGIAAIMTAGGGTGVDNETIRFAIAMFAGLVALALSAKAAIEWRESRHVRDTDDTSRID